MVICAREPGRVEAAARELGAIGVVSDLSAPGAVDALAREEAVSPGSRGATMMPGLPHPWSPKFLALSGVSGRDAGSRHSLRVLLN